MDLADDPDVRIESADRVPMDDIQTVFGTTGYACRCQCQRIRQGDHDWYPKSVGERTMDLHEQLQTEQGGGGIVAYLGDEPIGWCAVDRRPGYRRYGKRSGIPWTGRTENVDDESVWAAVCFVVRKDHRGRGLTYALVRGAVEQARSFGADAIEGYPMIVAPGTNVTWDEFNVGPVGAFRAAGFAEVSHPTKRRLVMRLEL